MNDDLAYEFQPNDERITVIGISGVESSGRKDGVELWDKVRKSALLGLKHIRGTYPDKYTSGLHIYIGEHNDHLWLGFNNPGSFLSEIFMKQLVEKLPNTNFVIEEATSLIIPMVYSYYPSRILAFGTERKVSDVFRDDEYGSGLDLTAAELFPEGMRSLL